MSNLMRGLVGGAASLGVIGTGLGLYAVHPPEHAATTIVVDDTAEILHEPTLLRGLERVRFHEPTDVAVFTHRGGPEARVNDLALNDAVLAHARETRTEWISADEQKWADDLFIFAVDPEGRLVGTYFGENRKVNQDVQLEIQDATKDDLRERQWTRGAVKGVQEAADRMNAPFSRTDGGIGLGTVAGIATVGASGIWLAVGLFRARRARTARGEGDRRMASVVHDYEVTKLHAHLIPEDSRYGGLMLRRYEDFQRGFRELTDLGNEARAFTDRDINTAKAVERLTAYRDKARAMDKLDDVIADTAALLNLDNAWPLAWERQVEPLRADLEDVGPMLLEQIDEKARDVPEAQQLREFASQQLARLKEIRRELETRRLSPDDALDHLRRTRDRLSGLLDELVSAVARALYDKASERDAMLREVRKTRNAPTFEPTIISTADPTWTWFSVASFRSSYTSGTSAAQASEYSGSGSSSGYSGGGSFSGAGSSSRF